MKKLLLSSIALAGAVASQGVITFNGLDVVANQGDPRPNANAAAVNFDTIAGSNASISVATFEPVAVGTISGAIASNASVVGNNIDSAAGVSTFNNNLFVGFNTTFNGRKFYKIDNANNSQTASLTFNFATPINSFGAFFTGIGTANGQTKVQWVNSQGAQSITLGGDINPSVQFFGLIDLGEAFTQVTVQMDFTPGTGEIFDEIGVDDVRYSNCNPVPEPASIAALGLGLAAVIRRRRK